MDLIVFVSLAREVFFMSFSLSTLIQDLPFEFLFL